MKGIISFTLLSLLFSCTSKEKNKKDSSPISYNYYNLEQQGWKSKKYTQKVDNINFIATEVPVQYYLLKDQGNQDLKKIDSIYQENKTERIIEFSFTDEEQRELLQKKFTNIEDKEAIEYLSFKMQNDFYAVTDKKDTIRCSGLLYERNFKVTPYHKIILYFSNINPNDKIQLVYQDKLFNKGTLKFKFNEQIINL
jgi:hypothetical protein